MCLSHLIYTARPFLIHTCHAAPIPCSDHAVLLKATAQHGRRETALCYLPAFGFFRLPRGVPRRLLPEAYRSSSQRSIPATVKSGSSTIQKKGDLFTFYCLAVSLCTARFNIQKVVLALRWVLCTDLRTDSGLCCICHWLVFITVVESVYSAVRTGSLNKAVCASSLKG